MTTNYETENAFYDIYLHIHIYLRRHPHLSLLLLSNSSTPCTQQVKRRWIGESKQIFNRVMANVLITDCVRIKQNESTLLTLLFFQCTIDGILFWTRPLTSLTHSSYTWDTLLISTITFRNHIPGIGFSCSERTVPGTSSTPRAHGLLFFHLPSDNRCAACELRVST